MNIPCGRDHATGDVQLTQGRITDQIKHTAAGGLHLKYGLWRRYPISKASLVKNGDRRQRKQGQYRVAGAIADAVYQKPREDGADKSRHRETDRHEAEVHTPGFGPAEFAGQLLSAYMDAHEAHADRGAADKQGSNLEGHHRHQHATRQHSRAPEHGRSYADAVNLPAGRYRHHHRQQTDEGQQQPYCKRRGAKLNTR